MVGLNVLQSVPPQSACTTNFSDAHAEGMMEALDFVDQAALICDGCGQVLHINRRAETLLASSFVATARAIDFEDIAAEAEFRDVLQKALVEGAPHVPGIVRLRRADKIGVRATSLMRYLPPLQSDGAVLLLMMRETASLDDMLATRFGFTAAEVRVVRRMAEGASIIEIAERHGVRPATVRSQLKSIFAKTQTHRQSQLVALVASVRIEVLAGN